MSSHSDLLRGWVDWPDNEAYATELGRLLAVAQEGGATIAECLAAASRLDVADPASWRGEWSRLADANRRRAEQAFGAGHIATARNCWLRSANYYLAASIAQPADVEPADIQHADVAGEDLSLVRRCVEKYLANLRPRGEVVVVPWLDGHSLDGYLSFPVASDSAPVPAVICIGESGRRKHELFFAMARHARDRGMALLCVDVGYDAALVESGVRATRPETSVAALVDYLMEREDIDGDRIAVIGDGAASSWVTRGVAFDRRLAAAVCDGGLEELWQSDAAAGHGGFPAMIRPVPLARKTGCPVLVVIDEFGWLDPQWAGKLLAHDDAAPSNLSLKVFEAAETGASHASADNPTLANEFIFDWIGRQMAARLVAGNRQFSPR
ncbi:dienelactone hydrolase [Rhodopseudomonas sp. BAL398]|uniref:alpha/beta hydrolase family protein n=1 Tax=Rhodopseudomonas sp. BAL398 TaxID=3034676 RepID=UPI0023E0C939|nr:dienelactone hydrolase [Rhodopseudomonas sp. BAL398]MDF3809136.1 dienelactone hydrolase [Rhodopseudomonas sp. BAL398]